MSTKMITLPQGLTFDFRNLLHEQGVTPRDIDHLQDKIDAAHREIQTLRETGFIPHHCSKDGSPEDVLFTQLPYLDRGHDHLNTTETVQQLITWGESLKNQVDTVVSLGIGGSFLGNKVLFDLQCGEFWNELTPAERGGRPKYYFSGNNVDPAHTSQLAEHLQRDARITPDYHVLLQIISKSGSTMETMACFFVLQQKLKEANIKTTVVAVTDPRDDEKETILHKMAVKNGWQIFRVPDGVGGRFSVFSDVGLVTGAALGFDIHAFLQGARDADQQTQAADPFENMALLNAVLKYLAYVKYGRNIEVFMPYSNTLKSLAEWYIQLLAESLGKKYDRAGNVVHYGRTPIVAVGTTDMHAQVQQHQEGTLDKVVQFVRVEQWNPDPVIPNPYPEFPAFNAFTNISMSQGLDAALAANAEAQISAGRLNATFTLPQLNAYYVGQIMYILALSVAYEGALANVDAFNQPGVEAYKTIMKTKLKPEN
ncbi:MAG: glucose-6-phosphate isomerase [Gemmatimonadetes bacterium]|nr:MAG: glucose-6-phosphate isomerase [Gemmatimonadota bacterium]